MAANTSRVMCFFLCSGLLKCLLGTETLPYVGASPVMKENSRFFCPEIQFQATYHLH
jgi:hypothetical protein